MVDRNLTNLEAVALAVRSEIDSTDLYGRLAERVKNPEVRRLLEELQTDEEHHREGLMRVYERMLGGQDPSIPEKDGRGNKVDIDPDADYLTVMRAARDKEFSSEEFYRHAASTVLDHKTRTFFVELAESERSHSSTLQKLVDRLEEDPHCFDREDTDPFKGIHVGP